MPNSIIKNPIPVEINSSQTTRYTFVDVPVYIQGGCTINQLTVTNDLRIGSSNTNIASEITAIKDKINEIIIAVNAGLSRNIGPL